MGEMAPAVVVAMVATVQDAVVDYPLYLILPEDVAEFKDQNDGNQPGLVWVPMDNVMDLRGPLPRKLPRR